MNAEPPRSRAKGPGSSRPTLTEPRGHPPDGVDPPPAQPAYGRSPLPIRAGARAHLGGRSSQRRSVSVKTAWHLLSRVSPTHLKTDRDDDMVMRFVHDPEERLVTMSVRGLNVEFEPEVKPVLAP